ncbi:MAG: hypothetical protein JRH00_06935 [Deltaproteobacteria bacterium]|nr:hypothetical protein [Deltaproteobacteria bacterium]
MRQKRKSRKKKGALSLLSGDQEALVTALLREIGGSDPARIVERLPDALCAEAFVERLPLNHESSIPLLLALRQGFREKNVARAVKRAAFRLEKRGIPIKGLGRSEKASQSILKPPPKIPPDCCLGPVDGEGVRSVVVMDYRRGGGVRVGAGLISDEQGILQFFHARDMDRRGAKRLKEDFSRNLGPLVETSLSHLAAVLEQAYQRHLTLESEVPSDFLELRPWLLSDAPDPERPDVKTLIHERSIPDSSLIDLKITDLLDHELMDNWLIDYDLLEAYLDEMFRIRESPLILTKTQKYARLKEIEDRCVRELFPDPRRELLKSRLEETAYVFFKLGEEDMAGIAVAAADTLAEGITAFMANPVVQALVERSVAYYIKAMEDGESGYGEEKGEPSRIILP